MNPNPTKITANYLLLLIAIVTFCNGCRWPGVPTIQPDSMRLPHDGRVLIAEAIGQTDIHFDEYESVIAWLPENMRVD